MLLAYLTYAAQQIKAIRMHKSKWADIFSQGNYGIQKAPKKCLLLLGCRSVAEQSQTVTVGLLDLRRYQSQKNSMNNYEYIDY
jgi:hypothetical protein